MPEPIDDFESPIHIPEERQLTQEETEDWAVKTDYGPDFQAPEVLHIPNPERPGVFSEYSYDKKTGHYKLSQPEIDQTDPDFPEDEIYGISEIDHKTRLYEARRSYDDMDQFHFVRFRHLKTPDEAKEEWDLAQKTLERLNDPKYDPPSDKELEDGADYSYFEDKDQEYASLKEQLHIDQPTADTVYNILLGVRAGWINQEIADHYTNAFFDYQNGTITQEQFQRARDSLEAQMVSIASQYEGYIDCNPHEIHLIAQEIAREEDPEEVIAGIRDNIRDEAFVDFFGRNHDEWLSHLEHYKRHALPGSIYPQTDSE